MLQEVGERFARLLNNVLNVLRRLHHPWTDRCARPLERCLFDVSCAFMGAGDIPGVRSNDIAQVSRLRIRGCAS